MKEKIERLYRLYAANGFRATTDTRKLQPGDVFFALKGDNFDGNDFVAQALDAGAGAVVADDASRYVDTDRIVLVSDTLQALQQLATEHRLRLGIPVLCLTGSAGKTTTKELLRTVLACRFQVCATQGNLNNHIGVPLTLLSLRPDHDFAVVEMGASHPDEISRLCAIARPDYGYITNFGRAHLEGFGGVEGVIRAKSELYDFLRAHAATAFVNADDPIQMQRSEGIRRFSFSSAGHSCDTAVELVSSLPEVCGRFAQTEFSTHLSGEYNFTNACAAIAVGSYFGIEPRKIAQALASYVPSNNRSQWMERGENTVMMDAYNANPTSMALSMENFARTCTAPRGKIAVLGDMFELGAYAASEHRNIVELADRLAFDHVYLVGEHFSSVATTQGKRSVFRNFEDFAQQFVPSAQPAAYLVKGSRGMRMERFLELLQRF